MGRCWGDPKLMPNYKASNALLLFSIQIFMDKEQIGASYCKCNKKNKRGKGLELRGKMKGDFRVFLLGHLQGKRNLPKTPIALVCLVPKTSVFTFRKSLVVVVFLCFPVLTQHALCTLRFSKVHLAEYSCSKRYCITSNCSAPHGADHFPPVEVKGKQLRHAFVHQLVDAFVELLGLHGVGIVDKSKMLWGKLGIPL